MYLRNTGNCFLINRRLQHSSSGLYVRRPVCAHHVASGRCFRRGISASKHAAQLSRFYSHSAFWCIFFETKRGRGRGGFSLAACLSRSAIDYAFLSRRKTVPRPHRYTTNIWVSSSTAEGGEGRGGLVQSSMYGFFESVSDPERGHIAAICLGYYASPHFVV